MQRHHRNQATYSCGSPQDDRKGESNPDHIHRKAEKDLRDSPARTESTNFENYLRRRRAVHHRQIRDGREGGRKRQNHQRENCPGEPGVLPGPSSSVLHRHGEAGVCNTGNNEGCDPARRTTHDGLSSAELGPGQLVGISKAAQIAQRQTPNT